MPNLIDSKSTHQKIKQSFNFFGFSPAFRHCLQVQKLSNKIVRKNKINSSFQSLFSSSKNPFFEKNVEKYGKPVLISRKTSIFISRKKDPKNISAILKENLHSSFFQNLETKAISDRNVCEFPFWNSCFDKSRLKTFVLWFFKTYGEKKTLQLLEQLKNLGFSSATQAGVSLGIDDLLIPPQKMEFLYHNNRIVHQNNSKYKNAKITAVEKIQVFIDSWNETSENLKKEVIQYFEKTDIFNPVYMMAFSGARGNISQVRQLVGMRGLMSDPQGNIIDFPIQSNFREGLTLTEYIISTYGARKGIVDTALRTATAGYLTRRLVDVAQHVMISLFDCKTNRGIYLFDMKEGNQTLYSFQNRLVGRVLANDIKKNGKILALRNQEISSSLASTIAEIRKKAFVRSPLTCQSSKFICQLCYGWSLSSNKLVSLGEAVGVIAAQSIGEPGTQLTMRTFHTGGVFSGGITESIIAKFDGWIEYLDAIPGSCIRTLQGKIAFLTKIQSSFVLKKNNEISFHKIPAYAILFFKHKQLVKKKQILAQFSNIRNIRKSAEQMVLADLEGEVFFNEMDLIEQKSKIDTLWKSFSKSKIWILSGKIFQINDHFLPNNLDFVHPNSIYERISWYNSRNNSYFLTNEKNDNFIFQRTLFNFEQSSKSKEQSSSIRFHSIPFKLLPTSLESKKLEKSWKNKVLLNKRPSFESKEVGIERRKFELIDSNFLQRSSKSQKKKWKYPTFLSLKKKILLPYKKPMKDLPRDQVYFSKKKWLKFFLQFQAIQNPNFFFNSKNIKLQIPSIYQYKSYFRSVLKNKSNSNKRTNDFKAFGIHQGIKIKGQKTLKDLDFISYRKDPFKFLPNFLSSKYSLTENKEKLLDNKNEPDKFFEKIHSKNLFEIKRKNGEKMEPARLFQSSNSNLQKKAGFAKKQPMKEIKGHSWLTPMISFPLRNIHFQNNIYIFHFGKKSQKSQKLLSFLPLNGSQFSKNKLPPSVFSFFPSDFQTNPGLFFFSPKSKDWNFPNIFWIQKRRWKFHSTSNELLSNRTSSILFQRSWNRMESNGIEEIPKKMLSILSPFRFIRTKSIQVQKNQTNVKFHHFSTKKGFEFLFPFSPHFQKWSVSYQYFHWIPQKTFPFFANKIEDNKWKLFLVNRQGKKKNFHLKISGILIPNFSSTIPYLYFQSIIRKNRKKKSNLRNSFERTNNQTNLVHSKSVELNRFNGKKPVLLIQNSTQNSFFYYSKIQKQRRMESSVFHHLNLNKKVFPKNQVMTQPLKKMFFMQIENSGIKKNIDPFYSVLFSNLIFQNIKKKSFLTKQPINSFSKNPKFFDSNKALWISTSLEDILFNRKSSFEKTFFENGSIVQSPKQSFFFTCFPFEKMGGQNSLSNLVSHQKILFNHFSYLKKFHMTLKEGWIYRVPLNSTIFDYHQIFVYLGKNVIHDIYFQSNSIFVENFFWKNSSTFVGPTKNPFKKSSFKNPKCRYLVPEIQTREGLALLLRPIYSKILPHSKSIKNQLSIIEKFNSRTFSNPLFSYEFRKDFHNNFLNKQSLSMDFLSNFAFFDYSLQPSNKIGRKNSFISLTKDSLFFKDIGKNLKMRKSEFMKNGQNEGFKKSHFQETSGENTELIGKKNYWIKRWIEPKNVFSSPNFLSLSYKTFFCYSFELFSNHFMSSSNLFPPSSNGTERTPPTYFHTIESNQFKTSFNKNFYFHSSHSFINPNSSLFLQNSPLSASPFFGLTKKNPLNHKSPKQKFELPLKIENIYSLPYFQWFFIKSGNSKMFRFPNSQNSFLFSKFPLVSKNQVFAHTDKRIPFQGELLEPFQNSWWKNSKEMNEKQKWSEQRFSVISQQKTKHHTFLTKKDIFSIVFPQLNSFIQSQFFDFQNRSFLSRKIHIEKFQKKYYPKEIQILIFEFHPNSEKNILKKSLESILFDSIPTSSIPTNLEEVRKGINLGKPINNQLFLHTILLEGKWSQKQEKILSSLRLTPILNSFYSFHAQESQIENFHIQKFFTKYQKGFYKLKGLTIGKPNRFVKLRLGKFLFKGDLFNPLTSFHKTGLVIHLNFRKGTFRYAQSFLVSAKGILHVHQGDSIMKNDPLLTLPFDTFTTGDIVQGIPKVEQYLEARTTRNNRPNINSLPMLLQGIFQRYCTKFSLEQAVNQSFLKIQLIIVDGVQRVYRSQGVSIADKHLEVIVKQMTSKVQIIHGGQTGFFPGELVDLEVVERINRFLMIQIQYEPIVLGITRASLEVESFLSAASFQQTTKILAKASLYRKKDFLKGLKENILIGNLIPAGTGYINFI